jgi:hypothetical protein
MPELKYENRTIELELPGIPGSKVTVRNSILAKDVQLLMEKGCYNEDSAKKQFVPILSVIIVAWNLTDEKGEILPINEENISKLEVDDAMEIVKQLKGGASFLAPTQPNKEGSRS